MECLVIDYVEDRCDNICNQLKKIEGLTLYRFNEKSDITIKDLPINKKSDITGPHISCSKWQLKPDGDKDYPGWKTPEEPSLLIDNIDIILLHLGKKDENNNEAGNPGSIRLLAETFLCLQNTCYIYAYTGGSEQLNINSLLNDDTIKKWDPDKHFYFDLQREENADKIGCISQSIESIVKRQPFTPPIKPKRSKNREKKLANSLIQSAIDLLADFKKSEAPEKKEHTDEIIAKLNEKLRGDF